MNRVLTRIITSIIPCKTERHRWRGILRFGLLNSIKVLLNIRRNHTKPQYYLAVCAIAKNEGSYFKEWIEWHRSMGVEKFYIYDNESTDCTKEVLAPYIETNSIDGGNLVEYTYFPGEKKQMAAYDDCMNKHRFNARWIAFIDLDEFIVPIKDKTIPEFLSRFENYTAVEINWLIYGSGGQKTKKPGTMMERFKFHSIPDNPLNRFVKSIVNPRKVFAMIGCHEAARISGYTVDSHGNEIKQSFRLRSPQQDIIRINHYAVKSYEEFKSKQARGRATGKTKRREDEYFYRLDLNDIEDI